MTLAELYRAELAVIQVRELLAITSRKNGRIIILAAFTWNWIFLCVLVLCFSRLFGTGQITVYNYNVVQHSTSILLHL